MPMGESLESVGGSARCGRLLGMTTARLRQADSDAFPGYDHNRALFHRVRVLFNQGVHGVANSTS